MNLHNEIMNIPVPTDFDYADFSNKVHAYKSGHRDARHAAAELAIQSDAYIEKLEYYIRKMAGGDILQEIKEEFGYDC